MLKRNKYEFDWPKYWTFDIHNFKALPEFLFVHPGETKDVELHTKMKTQLLG
jgi:hypothetical protein